MSEIPDDELLRAPQNSLTDAQWAEMKARHAAENERLRTYNGEIFVNVKGSRHLFKAGQPIHLGPDHAGSAVTVTTDDEMLLATFFLPKSEEDHIELVHPGPPSLTLSVSGDTAWVQREITSFDLSRFDDANWLRCHWIVASLLAAAWMIIGAQVTLVEAIHGSFKASDYAAAVNAYLLGTIPGAFFFGWLANRVGRKPVYTASAIIYVATAFATNLSSPDHSTLPVFRFLVGLAVGGEYVALNTTVQELMPKRDRGWACIAINGTFWLGSLVVNLILLAWPEDNWRTVFLVVGALGLVLWVLRLFLPESPRWLIAHYPQSQNRWTQWMLKEIRRDPGKRQNYPREDAYRVLVPARAQGWFPVGLLWNGYRRQTLVCLALICAQAFFYNAFYFRYGFAIDNIYSNDDPIPASNYYSSFIAMANLLGAMLLSRCFDKYGRKWTISATYMASGILLLGVAACIWWERLPLDSLGMAIALAMVFFVASAAASSAYLTMGESFPVEIRASAFAALFGAGMTLGVGGSVLYGILHKQIVFWFAVNEQQADVANLGVFSLVSAVAMIGAALVQWRFGTEYAGRPLEELAPSLSQIEPKDRVPARA